MRPGTGAFPIVTRLLVAPLVDLMLSCVTLSQPRPAGAGGHEQYQIAAAADPRRHAANRPTVSESLSHRVKEIKGLTLSQRGSLQGGRTSQPRSGLRPATRTQGVHDAFLHRSAPAWLS